MLKAKLLTSIVHDDINVILKVPNSHQVIVINSHNQFFLYSWGGDKMKLLYSYNHFPKNEKILELLYSHELKTVFVHCEKVLFLLNSNGLNNYDRMVESNGIMKCWIFEQPVIESNKKMTIMVYRTELLPKLKMFIWSGTDFEGIYEASLSKKSESIESICINKHGCIIASSLGVYYWKFHHSELVKIEKVIRSRLPKNLSLGLKELELHKPGINNNESSNLEVRTLSSSRKRSIMTSIWNKGHNINQVDEIRYLFHPSDTQGTIFIDWKTFTVTKFFISEFGVPYLEVFDHNPFFKWHANFDHIDFFTGKFVLLYDSSNIRVVDYSTGFKYLEFVVDEKIRKLYSDATYIFLWTMNNELKYYKIEIDDESLILCNLSNLTLYDFEQHIGFYENILSPDNQIQKDLSFVVGESLDSYILKLRQLSCLYALKSFEKFQRWVEDKDESEKSHESFEKIQDLIIKLVFDIFINFLASPELVISHCFPSEIFKGICGMPDVVSHYNKKNSFNIPKKLINRWYLPYLTEIRRNLRNLKTKSSSGSAIWKYHEYSISLTLNFFQEDCHNLLDIDTLLTIIDTVIFKLYFYYNPAMVGPFVRVENMCNFEVVEKNLRDHQMFHDLIDFYYCRKSHVAALDLITQLDQYLHMTKQFDALDKTIKTLIFDYLKKIPNEYLSIIFEYTDWLISKYHDHSFILREIFMNDSQICKELDHNKVYDFIKKYDDILSVKYLEYVIDIFHSTDGNIYFNLIKIYLENIQNLQIVNKLHALLRLPSYYEPRMVLKLFNRMLQLKDLTLENKKLLKFLKTYPLRKLGEHTHSLHILMDELCSYKQASLYCKEVYFSGDDIGIGIFRLFFENLLNNQDRLKSLYLFLQDHGSMLNTLDVLKTLPCELSIKELEIFLLKQIKQSSMNLVNSRIKKSLLHAELVNQNHELARTTSDYVVLSEKKICSMCGKQLSSGVADLFLLFHLHNKNMVTHYTCGRAGHEMLLKEYKTVTNSTKSVEVEYTNAQT